MAHVLAADYTPLSAVDIFVKDLGLVLDTARATKFPLPLASHRAPDVHAGVQRRLRPRGRRRGDQDLPRHHVPSRVRSEREPSAGPLRSRLASPRGIGRRRDVGPSCSARSPTTSPAPPTWPTRWCARGMRCVQTIGVPEGALDAEADAVVVALKSRTIPAGRRGGAIARRRCAGCRRRAREQVLLQVLLHLRQHAAGQHRPGRPMRCSMRWTARARLHDRLPGVPGQPAHGVQGPPVRRRRAAQRQRHAQPPADADDRRQPRARAAGADEAQGRAGGARRGRARVARRSASASTRCARKASASAVVDAVSNDDLMQIGVALAGLPLVTAGSGVAHGPAAELAWRAARSRPTAAVQSLPAVSGLAAVVSGSCSLATNAQVRHFRDRGRPALQIDPMALAAGDDAGGAQALAWAMRSPLDGPVLVYATAEPAAVQRVQAELGVARAGELVERALARIARRPGRARRAPTRRGRRRDLGRGGAGAGRHQLAIGAQIDPGVPWTAARSPAARNEWLHLALKSGNFGSTDFFTKAFERMAHGRSCAPRSAASARRCSTRGYVHATAGNISVRTDTGFLITPTDACLGHARCRAAGRCRTHRANKSAAIAHQDAGPAPRASTPPTRRALRDPHARHALRGAHAVRRVERDDIVPPITPYYVMKVGHVPLIALPPPRRPAVAADGGAAHRPGARTRRADPRRDARAPRPGGVAPHAGRGERGARRTRGDRAPVAADRGLRRSAMRRSTSCARTSAPPGSGAFGTAHAPFRRQPDHALPGARVPRPFRRRRGGRLRGRRVPVSLRARGEAARRTPGRPRPAAGAVQCAAGRLGRMASAALAALPGREDEFRRSVDTALQYAQALKCPRVHADGGAGAGRRRTRQAARHLPRQPGVGGEAGGERAASHCLIEPINTRDIPGFLLNRQDEAHASCRRSARRT